MESKNVKKEQLFVYKHPPYKNAENISKTDVRYEAPKTPTNQYDVELYKLKMEQMQRDKFFRIADTCGIYGLAIFGCAVAAYIVYKSFKFK